MSSCKQLDLGNEAERVVARMFKKAGYWCLIIPKNKTGGQPVDIAAMKADNNWLVDVKHLRSEDKSFPFSRIEPNQRDTMSYSRNYIGIKNIGFVICTGDYDKVEKSFKNCLFLHYDKVIELEKEGKKSAKIADLKEFKEVLI